MKVIDILKSNSLANSRILAGKEYLDKKITSVNVLEATDVEKWGRKGMVLLSSMFALQELNDEELSSFFARIEIIGISALIVKKDRLVKKIDPTIIRLCDTHHIPLIEISNNVKYESITLEILSPIIYKNSELLNKYYLTHNQFTKLSLKLLPLENVIEEISSHLKRAITLYYDDKNTISSNNDYDKFKLLTSGERLYHDLNNYHPLRFSAAYQDGTIKQLIQVRIPFVKGSQYRLYIHEDNSPIQEDEWIIIESAINLLQVELLKSYSLKQGVYLNKNNLVNDLLYDRLTNHDDYLDLLKKLSITKYENYRVLRLVVHSKTEREPEFYTQLFVMIRRILDELNINLAFYENYNRIAFVLNLPTSDFPIHGFNSKIENLLEKHQHEFIHWTISSTVDAYNIPLARNQAAKMHKLFLTDKTSYLDYESLGILKLLLQLDKPSEIIEFIPQNLYEFYKKEKEMFNTLRLFLQHEQNYSLTAEALYLHPKTVKYRINKIVEKGILDLNNSEDILEFQVAAKFIQLLDE